MSNKSLDDVKVDEASVELIEYLTGHDQQKNTYHAAIRPEVAKFAIEMEAVLRENDDKTGWDNMSIHALYSRIKGEFEELQREYILQTNALDGVNRRDRLRKEAIDVANFCMFLSHWSHENDPIRPKDEAYARRIDALFDRFVQPYVTE